jgi:hypothetical protein
VPLEQIMVQTGKRMGWQGFAPYLLIFEAHLAALLQRVASQVKPDAERKWIKPVSGVRRGIENHRHPLPAFG